MRYLKSVELLSIISPRGVPSQAAAGENKRERGGRGGGHDTQECLVKSEHYCTTRIRRAINDSSRVIYAPLIRDPGPK